MPSPGPFSTATTETAEATETAAGPLPAPEALAAYLDALPEPHIVCDTQYRIVAANTAYRRLFSPEADVRGRRCHEVSHHSPLPCDEAGETCPLTRARHTGQRERVLHLHHSPQGEEPVEIELVPVPDGRGRLMWFVERLQPRAPDAPGGPAATLVGRSAVFRQVLEQVARVGPSAASVLLLGESGTGKEGLARAVHDASPRAARPLVVVDCASLPESLFESELFGHERGAFTGATSARAGLVEAADGGTLFLDEVGDIPLPLQVKLLRLLESGTYRRVGSSDLRRADLRVVAATHRDLPRWVAEGRFREDLFHRLAVFPIVVPPLRARRDDIPLLAQALLQRLAPQRGLQLGARAVQLLQAQPLPGNVRELRNVLERAALLTDGPLLQAEVVARALRAGQGLGSAAAAWPAAWPAAGPAAAAAAPAPPPPLSPLKQAEQDALRQALAAHAGNRDALARSLGISPRTLYRRLRALQPV